LPFGWQRSSYGLLTAGTGFWLNERVAAMNVNERVTPDMLARLDAARAAYAEVEAEIAAVQGLPVHEL